MVRQRSDIPNNTVDVRASLFRDLFEPLPENKDSCNAVQRYLYHPECPYANKKTGRVLESRYVWWKNYPYDKLTKYDVLVHINGNRSDCSIENLKKTQQRHVYIHHTNCPYADSDNGKVLEEVYVWWTKYPDDIIKCGEYIVHVNGNNSDNRIENLVKVGNRSKVLSLYRK